MAWNTPAPDVKSVSRPDVLRNRALDRDEQPAHPRRIPGLRDRALSAGHVRPGRGVSLQGDHQAPQFRDMRRLDDSTGANRLGVARSNPPGRRVSLVERRPKLRQMNRPDRCDSGEDDRIGPRER